MVDAYPGAIMRDSVHVPNELDLCALTSLTRLELCGYTDDGNVLHRDFPDFSGDEDSAVAIKPNCRPRSVPPGSSSLVYHASL